MEKLASMSPEEDAKKAEAVLNQEAVEEEIIEEEKDGMKEELKKWIKNQSKKWS